MRYALALLALLSVALPVASGAEFHVSPQGDDAQPGTSEKPFATLERARDAIREIKKTGLPPGGVTVTLHAGLYERSRTFELSGQDAGTEAAPILYRANPGEEVRLSGAKRINGWKPVTDTAVLERLDSAARGHVVQTNVRDQGVTDFGKMGGGFGISGGPGIELFFRDQPTTLARYPNAGFIKITDVLGSTEARVRSQAGSVEGDFTYEGDRPSRWKDEKEPWVHGYWFHDWADQRQRVESIDPEAHRMILAKPYHGYGYRKGQWFYGFNLLCEIDTPGEWYLDRDTGTLYFWPPETISDGQATVTVLDLLLSVQGAAHVTFRGLTFEGTRGTPIHVANADQNQLIACTIRNTGGAAVSLNGKNSRVAGCDIHGTADGGISLQGGDRATLSPANLGAENNHIHHWSRWNRMYRNAIAMGGVGNRAANNLIHDAPHTAIGFSGNDHVIEFNEIHDVCKESNDAGAIYAGRDWTMRGTILRHNYMHHIRGLENRGCVGIYLDDMYCGTTILGNVFYDVTMAAFIGGGQDNRIENNVFVDCKPAVHVDSRGLGWAFYWPAEWVKEAESKGTIGGVRYDQPPYSTRYPELVNLLKNDPAAPAGSLIARNISVGGKWKDIDKKAEPYVKFVDNLVDEDPHFVDPANRDFQLKSDSPAFQLGFKSIPSTEKMGLIQNDERASWPAR